MLVGPVANTKGTSFAQARHFVVDHFGERGWVDVLERVTMADREVLESVVAVGWYDLALYARLIRAIDGAHGKGDLRLMNQLGRYEAEKDLKVVHRLFFRLANPAYVVEKAGEYWRRFHDTGTWNITRESPTVVHGTLSDWGVVDAALCAELTAYMTRIVELVGGRDPNIDHRVCRARGDSTCFFRMRWRDGGSSFPPNN
jgi:hypothetical protein